MICKPKLWIRVRNYGYWLGTNLDIDQVSKSAYGYLLTSLMPCESCCEAATAGTALESGATIWEPPAEDTEEAAGYISC